MAWDEDRDEQQAEMAAEGFAYPVTVEYDGRTYHTMLIALGGTLPVLDQGIADQIVEEGALFEVTLKVRAIGLARKLTYNEETKGRKRRLVATCKVVEVVSAARLSAMPDDPDEADAAEVAKDVTPRPIGKRKKKAEAEGYFAPMDPPEDGTMVTAPKGSAGRVAAGV